MSHIVWEQGHDYGSEGSSSQGANSSNPNQNSDSLAAPISSKLKKAQVLKYEISSSGSDAEFHMLQSSVASSGGKQQKLTAEHREEPQSLPSLGSEKHAIGECRPCAWFWKPLGCRSGSSCTYCHLCTQDAFEQKAAARKKARAARWRADKKLSAAAAKREQEEQEQDEQEGQEPG
mmetsp:Transcript_54578/g.127627  ORF Transcript_54578/g.127627 Transcript_54578/m.127627 type:complete len:176 (-) Transcript_54578:193-720(-)